MIAAALLVFLVDWGVMGAKIFTGDYDTLVQAWIGMICLVILLLCALYRLAGRRCLRAAKSTAPIAGRNAEREEGLSAS